MRSSIPILLRIAIKNVTANWGRSLICTATVAVCVSAMIILAGFQTGLTRQMIDASVKFGASHLRIYPDGFSAEPEYTRRIESPQHILDVIEVNPSVLAFGRKIKYPAMLESERHSRGVLMVGIDTEEQQRLRFLQDAVVAGSYLEPCGDGCQPAMIGEDLGLALELEVGDAVFLMTQTEDESVSGKRFRVTGFIKTGGILADKFEVYIPIDVAQTMLGCNDAITQIDVLLHKRGQIKRVVSRLTEELSGLPVEILPWQQLNPVIFEVTMKDRMFVRFILLILAFAVGTSLGNTLLNSVYDRQGEIGTILAIGARPSSIAVMVGFESLLIVLLGLGIGGLLGSGLILYLGTSGLDLSSVGEGIAQFIGNTTLYPMLVDTVLIWPMALMLLVSIAACIHPAAVAAKLAPVDAMWRRRR
jgi:putative ABC transport system permease protein